MDFKLEYLVNDEVTTFALVKDEIGVGKLSSNALQLNDNSVSRNHCKFVKVKNGYKLVDCGSTNGSFVNAKKIKEKQLKEGDNITIGRTSLRFLVGTEEESFSDKEDHKISMVIPLSEEYIAEKERRLEISKLNILTSLTLLGKELIAASSLEDSFEKVGELIFEFLNPKRLFVFFYDEKQEDLALKYSQTRKGKNIKEKINISKTIAMKAIKERAAILSSNTQDDARFDGAQSIIMYGITSAVSVPIWTKSSIYGLIYIDTTEFDQMFQEKDLEVLSIIANYTGLSIEGINSMKKLEQEKKIRSRLERYHSPSVVSRIMEHSTTMEMMTYKETEATVFFMDIVGFTTRVENMSAVEIGVFLNNFFTEMSDIIFHHQGTLDKYIGDCIMAAFGVPFEIYSHAESAISAAMDMMAKLDDINLQFADDEKVKIRIAISTGKLVAGEFGSPKRVDYTVLGNTVNIASRLESSVAKPNQIVVSHRTFELTSNVFEFEDLGEQKLSGLSVPVRAYKVLGKKEI
ncbi:MAG: FHA domain-containing protein [bacterium]|nr:FHA domain-containing protein [bacterium]